MSRVLSWLAPEVPGSRLAWFRALVYVFVVFDVVFLTYDVFAHAYHPEFYQPTLIPRLLGLPPVTTPIAWVLLIVIVVSCALGALGIWQRITGIAVLLSFWTWMFYTQGYGYVSHDHLALMIAVAVIPTVGVVRFGDRTASARAGWALQMVKIAVVLTYFYSVLTKWVASGSLVAWGNGAVFVWAIMRRGSDLIRWILDYPALLIIGQWSLLAVEILSPIALFLKRRALYAVVVFFLVFHLVTWLCLGIHFLPTVVCWAAFLPLERLDGVLRRVRDRRRRRMTA